MVVPWRWDLRRSARGRLAWAARPHRGGLGGAQCALPALRAKCPGARVFRRQGRLRRARCPGLVTECRGATARRSTGRPRRWRNLTLSAGAPLADTSWWARPAVRSCSSRTALLALADRRGQQREQRGAPRAEFITVAHMHSGLLPRPVLQDEPLASSLEPDEVMEQDGALGNITLPRLRILHPIVQVVPVKPAILRHQLAAKLKLQRALCQRWLSPCGLRRPRRLRRNDLGQRSSREKWRRGHRHAA